MKKMMKTWALVAVAAMGLTACQNEIDEQIEANDTVTVTLVDETDSTRTSVNTNGSEPKFSWGDEETFAVLEQTDALAQAKSVTFAKVSGKAQIDAEFAVNGGKSEYKYVAIYPQKGFVDGSSLESVSLSLPANQTMATDSYDPAADLMVSKVVSTDAQPTEAQMVQFYRMAAVAKLTLKNFNLELGDQVKSVIFAADGKQLAGKITANLSNPEEYTVAEGSSSVTVATTSKDVYFTLLPTTLEAGNTYSVIVLTDKYLYVKKGAIPADKSLEFAAGNVTRFSVNMSDIAPSDKWVLVKDASTLKQGDIVTIAAKDYDKAISTKLSGSETSTTVKRNPVDISKHENYLIANSDVQPFTLVTGTVDGTFSFYDEARGKFLVSTTTSSTYLINKEYCSADTSFAITINAETTVATITNKEGNYAGNLLRYNSNGYFVSNKSTSTVYKDVCLYRLEGAVGAIPTVAANVTVPTANVVVAEDGTNTATPIEEVVFNYVGDWTISVSTDAEWLNVSYAEGKVSYTSEQNFGAKREATVIVKATLEGQEALTWDFKVLQKSAALDITIADFVKLDKDENSTYRLTGKIVTAATNATSSGYYLADEKDNQVKINYLDTEDGENVWGHDDFTLVVGDIVTVTTVPVGSKTGGNTNHPSIYKGHYGIKASAGLAAEYTGGDVTIEVEVYSNGNVVAPTEIVGTMAENDFAEFSYSGGNTATVTFTSENTTNYAREAEVTFTCGLASATAVAQQGINPANKKGYELVTDASTLAVGDEIIIVAKDALKALGVSTGTITSQTNFPGVDIAKSGNVIYDAVEAGVQTFTLADADAVGKFALQFTHKGSSYYLYIGSTALKGNTSLGTYTKLSIFIDSEGAAEIKNSAGTAKFVSYNSTSTKFGTAAAANGSVAIYKKQK